MVEVDSRSQLHAEALVECLARHAPDETTDRMNQVPDERGEFALAPFGAVWRDGC